MGQTKTTATDFPNLIAKETTALGKKQGDDFFGLALSGGGIRSSTFSLGVIQHLAQLGLLKQLDYLSTVSGGGYLGSWLAAWIKQAGSIDVVETSLVPRPEPKAQDDEAAEIHWLRRYGKYLAPHWALFSADAWTIAALWLRNTLLNLTVLTTGMLAVLTIPWMIKLGYQDVQPSAEFFEWHRRLAVAATLFAVSGSLFAIRYCGQIAAFLLCVSTICYVFGTPQVPDASASFQLGAGLTFLCVVGMVDWEWKLWWRIVIRAALGIALGGALMAVAPPWLENLQRDLPFFAPILVPAVASYSYCVLLTFLMGILGRHVTDERREWWSRVGAWMFIFGWAWLLLAGVVLLGPSIVDFLRERYYLGIATGSLWAGLTAVGVYLGKSPSTGASGNAERPAWEKLLPLFPVVFMTGVFVLLASVLSYVVIDRKPIAREGLTYCAVCAVTEAEPDYSTTWHYVRNQFENEVRIPKGPEWPNKVLDKLPQAIISRLPVTSIVGNPVQWPLIAGLGLAFLYYLLGRLIDVNEFSMHRFYRNRLVRGFQGAARDAATGKNKRHADSFTNLDANDDVKMTDLQKGGLTPYRGPIHLVNTAINMNLTDTGLEERHAASFVFSPYGCGYSVGSKLRGYCQEYPKDCELRLGTAVTASGAAASPNMGYHTSTAIAFMLTVFNVRLGYWIQNPKMKRPGKWSCFGPHWGQWYFISELFGMADDASKYVYLSDGGHFENLAVYELLRRRCRYIICVDGEQDENMQFEGLAGLIRRARADMGIEIEIETADIEERSVEGWSKAHCSVGRVIYPKKAGDGPAKADDREHSKILYIKLSVTGDEPVDVLNYRKANRAFPHQSTGDQFFNESQFESYRRLGFHAAKHAFRAVDVPATTPKLDKIFEGLFDSWHGLPRAVAGNFISQTEALDALIKELATEAALKPLQEQLNRNWPPEMKIGRDLTADESRACFHYCERLIQFMENVYFEVDLESNFDSPACVGWMALFQDWAKSAIFQDTYGKTFAIFSKQFQNFYGRRIGPPVTASTAGKTRH